MKAKPPPGRRKFAGAWDEIGYLYDKLLYWLYRRGDRAKARPYADRLEQLLSRADPKGEAIFGEECRSLVHEAKGDLPRAIKHRKNEIRLIRRLHEVAHNHLQKDLILKGYGYDDLSDRLDLLATLYHDSARPDEAIATLQESERLCDEHAIPFDGGDLLREYLEEEGRKPRRARTSA